MSGNSFGQNFRITTFGEAHGKGIGVVIDGCPAGLNVDHQLIKKDLNRRKPGQSSITSQRKEEENYEILSGVFQGETLTLPNSDARPEHYNHLKNIYRPSHADFTYDKKYGRRDYRGGGRSSARETALRVIGGAFAKMILTKQVGTSITAYVRQIGDWALDVPYTSLDFDKIEENPVRCPDLSLAKQMVKHIKNVRKQGDTLGGTVQCVIQGVPPGWGEPVYDKLEADLAKAMLSINASKGFEIGEGFDSTTMRGSEHNDIYTTKDDKIVTTTNHAGGVLGGISTGMDIYFNVPFKPVSTLMQDQESVDSSGKRVTVQGKGRHDPCVVPRAVPIVEAMAAIVLVNHWMRNASSQLG